MSLRDRVNQLDKPETFEDRANKSSDREVTQIINDIERRIKNKEYIFVKGKKQITCPMYASILYFVGNDNYYADSPSYRGGSDSRYAVNNKYEADYFINLIKTKLEKEGCKCKVESHSDTSINGDGLWDLLFNGTTTRYTYHVTVIFEWSN